MSRFSPRSPALDSIGILTWMAVVCCHVSAEVPDAIRHSLFAPKTLPQKFEQQGSSVAISGNTAVVGSPLYDSDPLTGLDTGAVKIYDTLSGKLLHQLLSPAGTAFSYFGQAVAIAGSKVIVGSGAPVDGHPYAGCVYVYDMASATPTVPLLTLENPDPADYDLFGHSVAVEGNRVVVGAWLDDAGAVDSGTAYIYDLSSPTPGNPIFTLANPSPAANDCFGVAVAISGARVAVAAYQEDTGAPKAGRVYVYNLQSGTPVIPFLALSKPSPEPNDCFGNAVAFAGNRILVGVESGNAGGINSGSVLEFNLASGTPGTPVRTLNNPIPQENGYFGTSVSLSGDQAVVGAYRDDTGAPNAGTCYAYNLAGGTPGVPIAALRKPSPADSDYFANAVAISGTRILVAAFLDDTGELEGGASYVFDLSSGTPGTPVSTLANPRGDSLDRFGAAVAIDGDLVVVGAPGSDAGASGAGRVSVHDLSASKPTTVMTYLDDPAPAVDEGFGGAVAVSGRFVVVGAAGDDGGADDAGRVYVYDLSSLPVTAPYCVIPNPAPAAGDRFGNSVAISGSTVVIGAALDDAGATDSGSVYVFDLASPNPAVPVRTLANPGPAVDDGFGGSVSIWGTRVVVGAAKDDSGAANAGIAYIFNLAGGTPSVPVHTLLNPDPQADDSFGIAVAISVGRVAVGASGDDTGAVNAGVAYVYDLDGATPASPKYTLLDPEPLADDRFGHAVAVSDPRVLVGAYLKNTPTDSGRSYSFDLSSATPTVASAMQKKSTSISGDQFGAAVAISGVIVVVGAPSDNKTANDKGAAYVFGPAAPELAVEDAAEVELLTGDSSGFGPVAMGAGGGGSLTFAILNTGITALAINGISVVGGDASDFAIGTGGSLSSVPADDDRSFTVNFNPSAAGIRTTTLRINSSDSDENPFDIVLTGQALSPEDDSDGDGLNDVAELRMASLGFNWEVPNPQLVAAFQATTSSAGFYQPGQVQALRMPPPALARNPVSGQSKLTLSFSRSSDFMHYQPLPLTAPQTVINAQGELEFTFSVPGNTAFLRLETK